MARCSVAAASLLEGCILGRRCPASNPEVPLKQGGTLQPMINFYLQVEPVPWRKKPKWLCTRRKPRSDGESRFNAFDALALEPVAQARGREEL